MSEEQTRRDYKDTLFRMLFREKKKLLSLYNAMNGTNYENEEDLEINTLENAIYMNMKNDVSFVFDFKLNLYEHQSSVNPNVPVRDLFYVSKVLQNLTQDMNLYGTKKVQIPTPKFVVFYNGQKELPERSEYRLSDLFEKPVEEPELELIVTVLNINPGKNEELMKACRTLKEYMLYVAKVRENQKTMSVADSVRKAVDDCIREGILEDFLRKYKAEAIEVSIFEYDEEKHMKFIREEGREEGRKEGRTEGMLASIKVLITDNLEEGISPERIVEKLVRHYELSEGEAQKYLEEHTTKEKNALAQ